MTAISFEGYKKFPSKTASLKVDICLRKKNLFTRPNCAFCEI